MSATSHYAILVDLENCGAKAEMLSHIIERVKIRGDILLGRVYGFTDRYSSLKELLLSNTFSVVPSLRFGHHQKNNLDIQLVIDALEIAYTNELIDSFCIVSGDSDYTPLVGKLKTMGKFVLGISRSEVASNIFINACNEFMFLENVSKQKKKKETKQSAEEPLNDQDLAKMVETIIEDAEEDELYASELKGTLLRLRPDFNEQAFGFPSFGKLLAHIEKKFGTIHLTNDNYNLVVSLRRDTEEEAAPKQEITKDNFIDIFTAQLKSFKEAGFDCVNPSILKGAIQNDYPGFNERSLGCKRFSDLLKLLEKDGLCKVELDDQKTMLVRIC